MSENAFAWTDTPGPDQTTRVDLAAARAHEDFDDWTALDGAAGEATFPPRHAHLEQSRWLIRWSELVVVAWDGKPPAGPGGTADTVALAIAAGQPLIWIDTSSADWQPNLVRPERLWHDGSWQEWWQTLRDPESRESGLLTPATPGSISDALTPRFAPPPAPTEAASRADYLQGEPQFGWPARIVNRVLVRWWRVLNEALGRAGPPPARHPQSHPAIAAAMLRADSFATTLGNIHRAAQVALLVASVIAVLLGTLPAVFHSAKIPAVALELAVIIAAQFYYLALTRQHTQFRWGEARRLAERLRALHTLWPLGIDYGDERSEPASTWTDWHARVIRRSIGPPTGPLLASRLRPIIDEARDYAWGIVSGQHDYHRLTHHRMERLHWLLKRIELIGFRVLTVAIVVFLVWSGAYYLHLAPKPFEWFAGTLLLFSAVLPAIAAACMGIEAKLSVIDGALRSAALAERYGQYMARLGAGSTDAAPRTVPIQHDIEVLRDAAATLVADVDKWRDSAAQRGIVSG